MGDPKTEVQKEALRRIFTRIKAGKKMTGYEAAVSGALGHKAIFNKEAGQWDVEDIVVEGGENIPDGAFILASNHDNEREDETQGKKGLGGFAQMIAVTFAAERERRKGKEFNPNTMWVHWLNAARPKVKWIRDFSYRIWETFGEGFGNIPVDQDDESFYPNSMFEIGKVIKEEGIVGIHPEAIDRPRLQEIHPKAELFFDTKVPLLRRRYKRELPIIPVIGYRKGAKIYVHIGKAVQPKAGEKLSKTVMYAMADLFPEDVDYKKGFYATQKEELKTVSLTS